jgi:hypothetical protein
MLIRRPPAQPGWGQVKGKAGETASLVRVAAVREKADILAGKKVIDVWELQPSLDSQQQS